MTHWLISPRWVLLTVCACPLIACAGDVALQNPHTGQITTCRESLAGFDPWSQKDACVASYITQGWVISGRNPGISMAGNTTR
jgi:hypothetical protein